MWADVNECMDAYLYMNFMRWASLLPLTGMCVLISQISGTNKKPKFLIVDLLQSLLILFRFLLSVLWP